MSDIDWSKAPEGTTHSYPVDPNPWRRVDGIRAFRWTGEGWRFVPNAALSQYVERPTTVADLIALGYVGDVGFKVSEAARVVKPWVGVGIPPVDTKCEYFTERGDSWCDAVVSYVGSHLLLVSYAHPTEGLQESCMNYTVTTPPLSTRLRPKRTPEQIAAEERKAAIDAMCKECGYDGGGATYYTCAGLYDAGYRPVQP